MKAMAMKITAEALDRLMERFHVYTDEQLAALLNVTPGDMLKLKNGAPVGASLCARVGGLLGDEVDTISRYITAVD